MVPRGPERVSEESTLQMFSGIYRDSAGKSECGDILQRLHILRKLAPLAAPHLLTPCPPWRSKTFLGGFLHLSQIKFEEISPKITGM